MPVPPSPLDPSPPVSSWTCSVTHAQQRCWMAQSPEQGCFQVAWHCVSRRTPPPGPDSSSCKLPPAMGSLFVEHSEVQPWQKVQGNLGRAMGQTLCDTRERERARNQNHFQAHICKTKTVDSLSLTSGLSFRFFPLFLGHRGIWWHVTSPSCHFLRSAQLSRRGRQNQGIPRLNTCAGISQTTALS